jgi:hypothetical protein
MVVLGTLGGIGVVAVALLLVDLFGRKSRRRGIQGNQVDASKAQSMNLPTLGRGMSEYLPPPGDERPPR